MKRVRAMAIVVSVLLLGWLGVHLALNREPRYEGRSLSGWLERYEQAFMSTLTGKGEVLAAPAVLVASTNALMHIGTNAIPFLLKKMTTKSNAFRYRFNGLLQKQPWIMFRFIDQRSLGEAGFQLLGTNAMMATPALAALTEDPDPGMRGAAVFCLRQVEPRREVLLPILLKTVRDPNWQVSAAASIYLNQLYPEEAKKAGVYKARRFAVAYGTKNVSTNAVVH
jgi:hypothetical protein